MASFAALRTTAARRITPLVVRQTQRRNFSLGGHTGPPPEWEGIDKVVRGFFPADYQLSMAILGGYVGLYVVYSISSSFKKAPAKVEEAPVAAPASTVSTGTIPDVDSEAFVTFVESEAFAKLLDSEDQLKALTD